MNMNLESSLSANLSRLENVKKWVLAHIGLKSGSHESLGPSWSENFWFSLVLVLSDPSDDRTGAWISVVDNSE